MRLNILNAFRRDPRRLQGQRDEARLRLRIRRREAAAAAIVIDRTPEHTSVDPVLRAQSVLQAPEDEHQAALALPEATRRDTESTRAAVFGYHAERIVSVCGHQQIGAADNREVAFLPVQTLDRMVQGHER